jgi:predicted NBD/HSP70 family sugar kinase
VTLDNVMVDTGATLLGLPADVIARHLAVVLLGIGVGAALFNDGVHYRGSTSSTGEWGQSMDQTVNISMLHV